MGSVLLRRQRRRRGGVALAPAILAVLLVAACTPDTIVPPVRPLPSDVAFAWPSVLDQTVDAAGRVDFRRLAAVHGALDIAAAAVAEADLPGMSRPERLAFLLNANNTLWTLGVVRAGIPDRLGPIGRLEALRLDRYTVAGRDMTLGTLQNDLILPLAAGPGGDWRVPLALYCPAVSCPRLARSAYTAAALDAQLEAAARRFLADPANVVVDPAARVVRISGVMGRTPGLIGTINRYRQGPAIPPGYRIETLPFDWTVAAIP